MLVFITIFEDKGKPITLGKNLSSDQRQESTTNSTHIWRRFRELNPGSIGGRRVLSPPRHPCLYPSSPFTHGNASFDAKTRERAYWQNSKALQDLKEYRTYRTLTSKFNKWGIFQTCVQPINSTASHDGIREQHMNSETVVKWKVPVHMQNVQYVGFKKKTGLGKPLLTDLPSSVPLIYWYCPPPLQGTPAECSLSVWLAS